jgi:hypothetical protein
MTRAALAAVAVLLILEVTLRAIGYAAPQWYQLDPQLGWQLHPHRHGWYIADGVRSPVHITPTGFRDREHTLDKPDGVYRIAVMGDEYSEAMAVPLQQTWWWQLPARLQRCGFQPDKLVEVLNFGVAGYGTAQEYVVLETKAMRYQPDLVLLQFAPGDVMDNSPTLAAQKNRPFFVLDRHGVPRIDDSFALAPSFDSRMQTRYRLAEEIADHSRSYQLARQMAELAFIGEAHADGSLAVLHEPRDAAWEDAWRVTEAVIAKMNAYSRRNGAELLVVAIPHPRQAEQGMSYPDQRIGAFATQSNIALVTLSESLTATMYLPSGRWTAEAHRAAAETVAQRLCTATRRPG